MAQVTAGTVGRFLIPIIGELDLGCIAGLAGLQEDQVNRPRSESAPDFFRPRPSIKKSSSLRLYTRIIECKNALRLRLSIREAGKIPVARTYARLYAAWFCSSCFAPTFGHDFEWFIYVKAPKNDRTIFPITHPDSLRSCRHGAFATPARKP